MRIKVRLYATLRRHVPSAADGVLSVDAPYGCRAADAIAKVGVDVHEVHILMINGVSSPLIRYLSKAIAWAYSLQ